jgi:hypothetical protein
VLKASNLALKFLLELAAFAALAYWGATVGEGAVAVLLAVAAPAVAIALWAIFAAPKSQRRLPRAARVTFELGVFALAALALLAAGSPLAAVLFAAFAFVNAVLLAAWDQLDS